jgi:hypothetical protein
MALVSHRTHVYPSKTCGYFTYNQVENSDILHSARARTHTHTQSAFICFVRFSEQRAEFTYVSLTNDFYNRAGVCLLRGTEPISYHLHHSQTDALLIIP